MMSRAAILLGLMALITTATSACGDDELFEVQTPPEMIELDTGDDDSTYVAMTADDIIIRVRAISQGDAPEDESPRAAHDFWVDAVEARMRTRGGYALLDEKDVQSADGTDGTRLEFGRDHDDHPYTYWLTLFVTDDTIHVIEAGGREDRFDDSRDAVNETLDSYRVLQ